MIAGKSHILVVDDELDIRELVADILEDYGYAVTTVHDASAASSAVRLNRFDAILLDIWLPGKDGITLLKEWGEQADFDTPVVMMSAHGSAQVAVESVRLGAYDYLEKPVSAGRLEITLRNAVKSGSVGADKKKPVATVKARLHLVGTSKLMQSLSQQIEVVASTSANVLIVGAVGSGKRTVAQMIHNTSNDEEVPLIVLDWLESEDENLDVSNLIAEARNGTILIPDIHTYEGCRQNILLDFISAFSVMSAQDSAGDLPRIIATVSDTIDTAVESGRFRPEILNRIAEIKVNVPALREYTEDIPELVGYFTDFLNQSENLRYKQFSTAALNCMRNHSWGGNLSELISVLRQVLAGGSNDTVSDIDIKPLLVERAVPLKQIVSDSGDEFFYSLPLRDARAHFERAYLLRNLKRFNSYSDLAQMTGLHRTSLFRKLREHGIELSPGYGSTNNKTDDSL